MKYKIILEEINVNGKKTIKSCDLESVYNYMDTNYGYKIGSDYK